MAVRQPFLERDFYSDPRRRARSAVVRLLRKPARRAGFDFELRSFYSPIPNLEVLDEGIWTGRSELPGVAFDVDAQASFLETELAEYTREFVAPVRATGARLEYYLENGLFGPGDAELLYAMIRRHRSRVVLELGAGFSTLVSASAVRANRAQGVETRLISCDPYADQAAAARVDGLAELRAVGAEELDFTEFAQLGEGDILFIDSSHAVRLGGDVVHLLCEVVPRLGPGVLVHVHDIYLPYAYPREWFEQFGWYWAEQYLLQALLAGNRNLEVLVGAHALWRDQRQRFAAVVPSVESGPAPLSFWIRTHSGA